MPSSRSSLLSASLSAGLGRCAASRWHVAASRVGDRREVLQLLDPHRVLLSGVKGNAYHPVDGM